MKYKILMSNKEEIIITEAEYQHFMKNTDSRFVQLNEQIINPSYVVSVSFDEDATDRENIKLIEKLQIGDLTDTEIQEIKVLRSQGKTKELNVLLKNNIKKLI